MELHHFLDFNFGNNRLSFPCSISLIDKKRFQHSESCIRLEHFTEHLLLYDQAVQDLDNLHFFMIQICSSAGSSVSMQFTSLSGIYYTLSKYSEYCIYNYPTCGSYASQMLLTRFVYVPWHIKHCRKLWHCYSTYKILQE